MVALSLVDPGIHKTLHAPAQPPAITVVPSRHNDRQIRRFLRRRRPAIAPTLMRRTHMLQSNVITFAHASWSAVPRDRDRGSNAAARGESPNGGQCARATGCIYGPANPECYN